MGWLSFLLSFGRNILQRCVEVLWRLASLTSLLHQTVGSFPPQNGQINVDSAVELDAFAALFMHCLTRTGGHFAQFDLIYSWLWYERRAEYDWHLQRLGVGHPTPNCTWSNISIEGQLPLNSVRSITDSEVKHLQTFSSNRCTYIVSPMTTLRTDSVVWGQAIKSGQFPRLRSGQDVSLPNSNTTTIGLGSDM